MSTLRHLLAAVLAFGSLCFMPGTARAAESYDNCAGFIDSLPATIATQGVWCLRHDLSTAITSGNAITIATNNVTIDCNDFKIGGLGAGDNSSALAIRADNRQNITVRHCNVRGFYQGIYLQGGAGHLVEDNRFDNNLFVGILVLGGDNNLVQRNRVFDTGGAPGAGASYGISAAADIVDNIISGVFAAATDTQPNGIEASGSGTTVHGNRIRGLAVAGAGYASGIRVFGAEGVVVDGNRIIASSDTTGYGVLGGVNTTCNDNVTVNFTNSYSACAAAANNTYLP